MLITKQDGSKEQFDPKKLKRSLKKAGASEPECADIISHIEAEITEGDTTSEIYKHAFKLLRELEQPLAARYSMRRAIRDLGPSGFPFEDFVARIFTARGYITETGAIVSGKCAEHELDLLAQNEQGCIGAELKFHNNLGIKSDLKVVLYVQARFDDLRKKQTENNITEGWLITNTKFTRNAISYGGCVGLTMVSWSYPEKGNLQDLIEEAGVQPITALTTLSKHEKTALLDQKVVLCRSLRENTGALHTAGVTGDKINDVLSESTMLCGS